MNQQTALTFVLSFVLAACGGIEKYGVAPIVNDAAVAADSATPPPPAMEDAGPAAPATECEEGEIRDEQCNEACGEGNSFRLCLEGVLRCRVRDVSLCPGGEEPPVEEVDAGMPSVDTDAGTPPPPPAMEDAGTPPPPPVDLCADQPAEVCTEACVGVGFRLCDPTTGEYGDCDIQVATPCTDAGTPPPPPADAGPTCTPTTEVCDGIDNDCNHEIDEDALDHGPLRRGDCYTGPAGTVGVGLCRLGEIQFCGEGTWGQCYGEIKPTTEICGNGLDEDCNGSDLPCATVTCSDTRIGTPCSSSGVGACIRTGTWVCNPSGVVECSATPGAPTAEICGDGIDQDCVGGDLACSPPTTDIWVAYQMKVDVPTWGTTNTYRLRNGSWWGDPNVIRCENTGSSEWEAIGDGWFECVARRVDPFNLSYLSTSSSHPGDLAAVIEAGSPATCQLTGGIQLRIFETNNVSDSRAAGAHYRNLIPGGSPSPLRVDGVCRLDLTT